MLVEDDRALARRMLAGETAAFDEFFHAHFERLYRFALARLYNDEQTAEEVVQHTLCRGIEKLSDFRGEATLFTWLCQICRNAIADVHRARAREGGPPVPFEDTEEIRAALESLAAMPMDDPQQATIDAQLQRFVQAILDSLPRRYADALEWKYVYGLSVKEIAERMQVGPKAAESVLSRARVAFRDEFASLTAADLVDAAKCVERA